MGKGQATTRRLSVPVLPVVEEALAHPEAFDLGRGPQPQGQLVAQLAALGAQTAKRARQEREELALYARYQNDPERQKAAPVLAQMAREDGVL